MPLEDEQMTSDTFNIPNSIDTQIFALESDPFKLSISHSSSCDQYLRENIGEPLSYALTYTVMYRPEDPIEFISEFLIDWSRKVTQQKLINHPLTTTSQSKEMPSQSDKHLSSFQQEDFPIDQHDDNEEKASNYYLKEQEQQQQRTPRQITHMHDTATEFDNVDDPMKNNSHSHRCQNGHLSDLSYFSALREKIIKCDES